MDSPLTVQDMGHMVKGVAGVERIDVRWTGEYTEIVVYPIDSKFTQSFDLEGFSAYVEGLMTVKTLAENIERKNIERKNGSTPRG